MQSSVEELGRELRNEIRKVSNPPGIRDPAPLTVLPSQIADAYAEINRSATSFQRLGESLPVNPFRAGRAIWPITIQTMIKYSNVIS